MKDLGANTEKASASLPQFLAAAAEAGFSIACSTSLACFRRRSKSEGPLDEAEGFVFLACGCGCAGAGGLLDFVSRSEDPLLVSSVSCCSNQILVSTKESFMRFNLHVLKRPSWKANGSIRCSVTVNFLLFTSLIVLV